MSIKLSKDRGWCGDPRRGAALGRPNQNLNGDFKVEPLPTPDGYDEGGTYWGVGSPESGYMFVAEDSEGNQAFTRAKSINEAQEEFEKLTL